MVSSVEDQKNLTVDLLQYVGRKLSIFIEFAVNDLNDAHPSKFFIFPIINIQLL